MRCFLALLLISLFSFSVRPTAQAQDIPNPTDRPILRKTVPRYPELARKMNLAGTVKLTAIVAPDGKVKSVQAVGGNPLLLDAAQEAISQWKYAPARAESKESIEVRFHP
jgi:TonB family protein